MVVVILKEFALYCSSKVKEMLNGTQQALLGNFTVCKNSQILGL